MLSRSMRVYLSIRCYHSVLHRLSIFLKNNLVSIYFLHVILTGWGAVVVYFYDSFAWPVCFPQFYIFQPNALETLYLL